MVLILKKCKIVVTNNGFNVLKNTFSPKVAFPIDYQKYKFEPIYYVIILSVVQ